MKLSSRELFLGWLTLIALALGLTYWFLQPRIREWSELGKQRKLVSSRHELAKRFLDQKPGLDERMESLRKKVPGYSKDKDVTSDYLKIIEQLAKENGLALIQRRPDREKPPKQGRLFELAMDCTWESDLASLVKFLAALDAQEHLVMDVRDLTVAPIPGKKGRLKGSFALLCMYTRSSESPAPQAKPAAAAAEPAKPSQPAPPATAPKQPSPPRRRSLRRRLWVKRSLKGLNDQVF